MNRDLSNQTPQEAEEQFILALAERMPERYDELQVQHQEDRDTLFLATVKYLQQFKMPKEIAAVLPRFTTGPELLEALKGWEQHAWYNVEKIKITFRHQL